MHPGIISVPALQIGAHEVAVSYNRCWRALKIIEAVAAGRTHKSPNVAPQCIDFQLQNPCFGYKSK